MQRFRTFTYALLSVILLQFVVISPTVFAQIASKSPLIKASVPPPPPPPPITIKDGVPAPQN